MSKYTKERVQKIVDALHAGDGRVRAVNKAGIAYDTFMEWLRNKPEFSEAIKKAEEVGDDKIKDICKRRIIEDSSWQSAAWWLERNFPDQYKNRTDNTHRIGLFDNSDQEKIKQAIIGLQDAIQGG